MCHNFFLVCIFPRFFYEGMVHSSHLFVCAYFSMSKVCRPFTFGLENDPLCPTSFYSKRLKLHKHLSSNYPFKSLNFFDVLRKQKNQESKKKGKLRMERKESLYFCVNDSQYILTRISQLIELNFTNSNNNLRTYHLVTTILTDQMPSHQSSTASLPCH